MDSEGSVAALVLISACLRSSGFIVEEEHACRWLWWRVQCQKDARRNRQLDCLECFPPTKSAEQVAIEAEAIALWQTLW